MSRNAFFVTLGLTILAALVFGLAPRIDLEVAYHFFSETGFAGSQIILKALRWILYVVPTLTLGCMILAWATVRAGMPLPSRLVPKGRSLVFLVASLALGPGLLVNSVLKDHSHRPRPAQVRDFGGPLEFRPFWRSDGGCARNCSFASGEAAAGFWLMAPASLAPPPYRLPAMAAAFALGAATGLLRMAFGGHFLSDIVFAGLLTLLVAQVFRALLVGRSQRAERLSPSVGSARELQDSRRI